MTAAFHCHDTIAELLIEFENKKGVKKTRTKNFEEALIIACGSGSERTVKALLANGADCNFSHHQNVTPLICAARSGRASVVKLLIDSGAAIDRFDASGRCALHYAAMNASCETFETLMSAGADISLKDNKGETPLDIIKSEGNTELLQIIDKYFK